MDDGCSIVHIHGRIRPPVRRDSGWESTDGRRDRSPYLTVTPRVHTGREVIARGLSYADLVLKNPRNSSLAPMKVRALVDTGAMYLCLPDHVVLQLRDLRRAPRPRRPVRRLGAS